MASVVNDGNGRRRVSFTGLDRKRRSLRLGKISEKRAHEIRRHVEVILSCAGSGTVLEQKTADWIGDLPDDWHSKLAAVGLVDPRQSAESRRIPTVSELVDVYIAKQTRQKEATKTVWRRVKRHLVAYFADRPIDEISTGDAEDWMNYLLGIPLAEATVRRACGVARQFFGYAVRHKLIAENPFVAKEIKTAVRGNDAKFYFISAADAEKILDACPSQEWRVIFALSRWGGLRCPSEHLALKWGHVDWEHNRLIVESPKTAHHQGHERRVIPLFPELREQLDALYAEADPGEFIITRYRDAGQNLRTTFEKIILRAGLKPWPKLFHNLRATRQTELADRFPAHVVSQWIGNSQAVAREHYLRTTDEHFSRAATEQTVEKATRNPTRAVPESTRTEGKSDAPEMQKPLQNRGFSRKPVGTTGLEPVTPSL